MGHFEEISESEEATKYKSQKGEIMKKLLAFILLMTFLFLTSCDNDTPTDESSSETSKIEETSTESQEELYYTTVFSGNGYNDGSLENMSKIVYTEYQEFVDEIADKNINLKDNFNKDIFNNNYLLITCTTVNSGGHTIYGFHDFKYESNNKMSIVADIRFPAYGEKVTDAHETFYHIVVISKNLFPDDVSKIPNEIEIIKNGVEK